MREILFRGKCLSSGEWIYGNLIHSQRFKGCSNEFRIHEKESGIESDIEPTSICQFTGLIDKNDIKIFEKDILKIKALTVRDINYMISYSSGASFIAIGKYWERVPKLYENIYIVQLDSISNISLNTEVVGNAIDEPQLVV